MLNKYKATNKKMLNKLLIIVPTLNSYKLLTRLVNSLKRQTSKEWSVLFVDGESNKRHKLWLDNTCKNDNRFNWIQQSNFKNGIYGAMNTGIQDKKEFSWLLFWGSDDWCSSSEVVSNLLNELNQEKKSGNEIDLFINKARYYSKNLKRGRDFKFKFISQNLKKSLFFGEVPAHQGVVFNSRLFQNNLYLNQLRIASDLEFFLRLSQKNIDVKYSNKTIVNMLEGGTSQKFFIKKIKEVISIYINYFGILFIVPFTMRYFKKIFNA